MSTDTSRLSDQPVVGAPSWRWALRRAVMGLLIMSVVTAGAAYLAHVSIDPVTAETEVTPPPIYIGTPAAALLKRQ